MAFARDHGVKYPTFIAWLNKRRARREEAAGAVDRPAFAEVLLEGPVLPSAAVPLRVVLPCGAAIEIGHRATLAVYTGDGRVEIDTNLIENAIRPTAVGKKNWLFVGGEDTGQRSAILYTFIEGARRHGHDPEAYLADVLGRLATMTNRDDLGELLPSRWQAPGAAAEAARCA